MASTEPVHSTSLADQLDTLLTRYLTLLDAHQALMASSHSNFRRGLFSLTEANFRSSDRIRYGQDLYSDKMRASLILDYSGPGTARIEDFTSNPRFQPKKLPTLSSAKRRRPSKSVEDDTVKSDSSATTPAPSIPLSANSHAQSSPDQLPTPPTSRDPTPSIETQTDTTDSSQIGTASSYQDQDQDLPPDPLRQFGILVPPALRAAQGTFSLAAEGWIQAAGLERQMREVEIEIGRARKRLRKAGNVGSGTRSDAMAGAEGHGGDD